MKGVPGIHKKKSGVHFSILKRMHLYPFELHILADVKVYLMLLHLQNMILAYNRDHHMECQ